MSAAESLVGAVIGGYELQERVGLDAGGDVYRALDPARGHATIRVLPHALDAVAADRLLRSAAGTAAIEDPHVVPVRSVVDAPHKRTALVMEDLDGRTLADEISVGGLATARILHLVDQIADAMIAIHGTGIVHGALSPSSVLLVVRDGDANFVRVLAVAGPEAGNDLDPREDVRALGVILYLMLSGVPPEVSGADAVPPPPSDFVGGERSPPWLDRLVMEMLSPDPEGRPASMFAVKQQLQKGRGLVHDQAVALAWADAPLAAGDLPAGRAEPEAPPPREPPSAPGGQLPAEVPAEARVAIPTAPAPAEWAPPRRRRAAPQEEMDLEGLPVRRVPVWAVLAAAGALVLVGGLYWMSRSGGSATPAAGEAPSRPDAAPVAAAAPASTPDAAPVAAVPPDAPAPAHVAAATPSDAAARAPAPAPIAPVAPAPVRPSPRPPDTAARAPAPATTAGKPRPPVAASPHAPTKPVRRPEGAAREPGGSGPGADFIRQGNAAKAAGRLDEAEQAYFRASTSGDRKAMADGTLGLADVALRRRRYSDAATKARRALSLGADRRTASEILGQAKCSLGSRDEAEAAFAEAASAGGPKRQCTSP